MTDVTALTDEELTAALADVQAEVHRRGTQQRLMDSAWSLVMEAKNNGYTKQQVGNALTNVVNEAYM